MKLILLIILIIFGFQSSAWGQAPTLSIEAKQEPIQEIMKKIEHQTGMTFSYDPSILKGISRITFKSDNQSISECLTRLFQKLPLSYQINGTHIILKKRPLSVTISVPPEQWDDFLRWAFDYEYRLLGLPAPDAVVYLQVDPAVSQKLMTGRYHGDESRKDVHEKDIEYLARSRRAAEYCAVHLGWATVHCTENGAMRTIEEIQAEVRALAEKELG